MDGRLTGKILWFNLTKGYGEICNDSGNRAFFTQSDCDGCLPGLLAPGQPVTFVECVGTIFGKSRVSAVALLKKKSRSKSQRTRRNEASA